MLRTVLFLALVAYAAAYSVCPMHVECIPGCVKLDEKGCKMCACGPMMFHPGAGYRGMPGGMVGGASFTPGTLGGGNMFGSIQGGSNSGGYHAVAPAEKPLKECTGTMLCMMTCKGHYSLSKDVGPNGCRACTCPKEHHVVTEVVVTKPQPKPQPQKTTEVIVVPKPATHTDCTGTKLCMMTCKGKYILGEHGRDGCQSCACVPEPQPPVVVQTKPKEECHEQIMCMLSCKHGYSLSSKCNDGCHDSCQKCTCIEPTPAPTPAPQRLSCPHTIQCMLSCKDGYHIGGVGKDGCPACSCLAPPKQNIIVYEVKCPSALTCPRGCTVGYKCDKNGCPTCECIHPQVVGVLTVTEIHTSQAVTCSQALTCSKSCSLGYKCGTDGCPTCGCLVQVHTVTNVKPVVQVSKPQPTTGVSTLISKCPHTLQCMSTCDNGYTLGSEGPDGCPKCTCIIPATSECHTSCAKKPAMTVHTCDATLSCMTSCTDGYTLSQGTGGDGCPVCTCKQTTCSTGCKETHQQVVQVVTTTGCTTGTCEKTCTDNSCGNTAVGGTLLVTGGTTGGGVATGGTSSGGGTVGGASGGGGGGAGGSGGGLTGGGQQCPPLPPNCHPYCIKYDVAHCRLCDCDNNVRGYSG